MVSLFEERKNMTKQRYSVKHTPSFPFENQVDFCVGSGRLGLALQKEYLDELRFVQEHIHFKYLRAHGLFCDDIAIFNVYEDAEGKRQIEYNFTYLDRIMDALLELDIRPFLEIGFMPEKMASGEQTIFYWKGNTTPPKDYQEWADLLQATLSHLVTRYGEEVYTWPIEVWNEPNLPGFWKDADKEEYFKLFKVSFNAIKELDARFQVGGPAICGVDDENWMRDFLNFCRDEDLAIDFVTRHHYTSELPETDGHYSYVKLHDLDGNMYPIKRSREIMQEYPQFKDLTMHITEFNTSYVPNAGIHDTNYNAAYVADLLAKFGQYQTTYSYWTFGDVFEEFGVPHAQFHGGFGMVAHHNIPKPTFWTFKFFKDIQDGQCILRTENMILVKTDNAYKGVLWNPMDEKKTILLEDISEIGEYSLVEKSVDEEHGNPLKVWHDLGEKKYIRQDEIGLLQEAACPHVKSSVVNFSEESQIEFLLNKHAILYFELTKRDFEGDRGYDYDRMLAQR